jgi:flagella basal body P-ring formation protein FlgA
MRGVVLCVALACIGAQAVADTVVAQRTVRATALIGPGDVALVPGNLPGGFHDPADVIGQEARVVLYAGRPVLAGDIGPPALVERNQIVRLIFRAGPVSILAEGRALGRGGVGDTLRVMNLDSRNTVSGLVGPDGSVHVIGPARTVAPFGG